MKICFNLTNSVATVNGWMEVDSHEDLTLLGKLLEGFTYTLEENSSPAKLTLTVLDTPATTLQPKQPKPAARKRGF